MSAKRRFGALRKLPSGRWQARYRTPEGREITAPHTFDTKTDANRFLDAVEVDQRRGVWHDPTPARNETLRTWAARWLAQHSVALTPSTAFSYRGLLECCVLDRVVEGREVGLGDLALTSLSPMRVGEWLADLQRSGLSASRVRKAYRILSLAMDAAVRDRLLPASPCGRHHRLPRLPEHEPTILTVTQVESLVANLRNGCPGTGKDRRSCQPIRPNPSLALVVELLAYGGLRIGEALALRRRHTDVLGCKLVVAESLAEVEGTFSFGPTKTHQVREVPLPRSLLVDLERHLDTEVGMKTDALMFTSQTGGPVRYRSLRTRRLGHSRASITTRHYVRPMAGGDTVVADRLDQARKAARVGLTTTDPSPDLARIWHAGPNCADGGLGPGEVNAL